IDPGEPLLPALERELRRAAAVVVPPDAWQPEQVPGHLRATFRVLDDRSRPLAAGKDLAALRAQVAPQARAGLARAASGLARTGRAPRASTTASTPPPRSSSPPRGDRLATWRRSRRWSGRRSSSCCR